MREIKFRAWVTFDGMEEMYSHQMLDDSDKNGLIHLFDVINGVERGVFIMQYTGLKDKNGVEIYEGDVVKTIWRPQKTHTVGIVIWLDEGCKYVLSNMDGTRQSSFPVKNIRNTEVIGNIYEDPDLVLNEER